MATVEQILEEAKTLPPDEQHRLRKELDREARLEQIRQTQAKYAHIRTSSEDFIARKAEEIASEDRHSRRT